MCWVGVSASLQSCGRAHVSLIPSVSIPLPPWPSRRGVGGVERRRGEREQQKKEPRLMCAPLCVRRNDRWSYTSVGKKYHDLFLSPSCCCEDSFSALSEKLTRIFALSVFPGEPGSPFCPAGPSCPMGPGSPARPLSPWTPLSPEIPGSPCRREPVGVFLAV